MSIENLKSQRAQAIHGRELLQHKSLKQLQWILPGYICIYNENIPDYINIYIFTYIYRTAD